MKLDLDFLLRAAWLTAILPLLLSFLPFSIFDPLRQTLLMFAARGKIAKGQLGKFSLPQSFFVHFYVVASIWTTFFLVAICAYAYSVMVLMASESLNASTIASHLIGGSHMLSSQKPRSTTIEHMNRLWRTIWLLLMMEFHSLRRLYESVYVFKYSKTARMHIVGYLTGLCFYIGVPLSLSAPFLPELLEYFTQQAKNYTVRGGSQVPDFKVDLFGYMKPLLRLGWCQYIGFIIYLVGMVHQYRCHVILGSLRVRKEEEEDYKIPHGDWFDLVSCAHYLAEIVIYFGILVASEGSNTTIWLLSGFVVTNLVLVARETHQWYQHKFDNYPKSRCAIIPYVC